MGFNKRKTEDARKAEAAKEAAARRELEPQVIADAERLVAEWNDRQAKRAPLLYSPTIGAAITAGYWFLRARCPACRTTGDVDLRRLELAPRRGGDGAHSESIVPILPAECAVRPTRRLFKSSVAEDVRAEWSSNSWVSE